MLSTKISPGIDKRFPLVKKTKDSRLLPLKIKQEIITTWNHFASNIASHILNHQIFLYMRLSPPTLKPLSADGYTYGNPFLTEFLFIFL